MPGEIVYFYDNKGNLLTETPASNEQALRDAFHKQGMTDFYVKNPQKEAALKLQNEALMKRYQESRKTQNNQDAKSTGDINQHFKESGDRPEPGNNQTDTGKRRYKKRGVPI